MLSRIMPILLPGMLGLLMAWLGAGCATARSSAIPPDSRAPLAVLLLAPGDEVEVAFLGAPHLNVVQAIRSDGKLALQLLGEVQAAGRTLKDLRDELSQLAEAHLQV